MLWLNHVDYSKNCTHYSYYAVVAAKIRLDRSSCTFAVLLSSAPSSSKMDCSAPKRCVHSWSSSSSTQQSRRADSKWTFTFLKCLVLIPNSKRA
mmetsp:Transcript_28075/g.68367  ORF Transcript_28075/g.68367 Transcript_28075/m.68367 type:complete len:94 (-) Transcript_28075:308-589(-)